MAQINLYNALHVTASIAFAAGCSGQGEKASFDESSKATAEDISFTSFAVSPELVPELTYRDYGTGMIEYNIENTGLEPLRVDPIRSGLALSGLDLFDVRLEGERVSSTTSFVPGSGKHTNTIIDAGEIDSRVIDLTSLYNMSKPGEYTVALRQFNYVAQVPSPIRVVVNEEYTTRKSDKRVLKAASLVGCNANERAILSNTETRAQGDLLTALRLVAGALGITRGNPAPPPEEFARPVYEKWFGAFNETRARHVAGVISLAATRLEFDRVKFTCNDAGDILFTRDGQNIGCADPGSDVDIGVNAVTDFGTLEGSLVREESPIRVCPEFINLVDDRRRSVLFHELSHHLGTRDFVTSPNSALDLARTNPETAILSAENYERFLDEF